MYRPRIYRLGFAMLTLLTLTACHRDSNLPIATPHDDAQQTPQTSSAPPSTASMPPPVTAAPPPPLPEGTSVTYQCVDGNQLTVTYTYVTADLRWPDGREVKLSRAASASGDGGDVYTGGKASLRRAGGSIQLDDGATATTCSESEATA